MKPISELKISPWPWKSGYGDSMVLDRRGMSIVNSDGDFWYKEDCVMSSAAPEMYEALAAMLHCAEKEAPYTDMSNMKIAMDMARKALAKSAGER